MLRALRRVDAVLARVSLPGDGVTDAERRAWAVKARKCAALLPDPGPEVVRDLCDELISALGECGEWREVADEYARARGELADMLGRRERETDWAAGQVYHAVRRALDESKAAKAVANAALAQRRHWHSGECEGEDCEKCSPLGVVTDDALIAFERAGGE